MVSKSYVKFIGSGCWQGIPAPFCDDQISNKVVFGDKDFRFRTSFALYSQTGKIIIIEITPDIRLQSWKFKLPKPEAFFVTHWHFDHLFGLLEMDWYAERYGLIIHASNTTKKWIDHSMGHIKSNVKVFNDFEPIIFEEYTITPFPVMHVETTHGFLITSETKKIAYVPDWNGLPKESLEFIKNADTVICDATYLESDLTNDVTHFTHNKLISYLKEHIHNKNIILTNIGSFSETNHDQLSSKYPDYKIAFDGMEIDLN